MWATWLEVQSLVSPWDEELVHTSSDTFGDSCGSSAEAGREVEILTQVRVALIGKNVTHIEVKQYMEKMQLEHCE